MTLMAGIYRHYKGGYYQVLGLAAHSETDERLVVYISVLPPEGSPPLPGPRLRVRPEAMWNELVKDLDCGEGHQDAPLVPRFKYVGSEIPTEESPASHGHQNF